MNPGVTLVAPILAILSFTSVFGVVGLINIALSVLSLTIEAELDPWLIAGAGLDLGLFAWLGMVLFRVSARALPRRVSGGRRPLALSAIGAALLAMGACVILIAGDAREVLSPPPRIQASDDSSLGGMLVDVAVADAVGVARVGRWVSWVAGANATLSLIVPLTLLLATHMRPASWRHRRYVLFLRPFSGTSNIAAPGALVRGAGDNVRLLFLAAPIHQATSWDPVALAFGGLNLFHPFASTPIYLISDGSAWQDDVRSIAAGAIAIAMDISEQRRSIVEETRIVGGLPGCVPVLWLRKRLRGSNEGTTGPVRSEESSALVEYEESRWKQAAARIVAFAAAHLFWLGLIWIVTGLSLGENPLDIGTFLAVVIVMAAAIPAAVVSRTLCPAVGYSRRSTAAVEAELRRMIERAG